MVQTLGDLHSSEKLLSAKANGKNMVQRQVGGISITVYYLLYVFVQAVLVYGPLLAVKFPYLE